MDLPDTWTNPKDGSILRRIPAGGFVMGSTPREIEEAAALDKDGALFALGHETPAFRAFLPDYYLGVYAVTNEQFARFLSETKPAPQQLGQWFSRLERIGEGPAFRVIAGFERHPVIHVSWYGAKAYCEWAGLRLPGEMEWEKAARGTDGRLFPWGNAWKPGALAWWSSHDAEHDTEPVDAFAEGASPYGILQMSGNVEEWCSDWYRPDVYRRYATGDFTPPQSGLGHVVRGGNCMFRHRLGFRCAMRRSSASAWVNILYTGIRCARSGNN